MIEIDNVTRLINGAHRNISLLTNTIVVDNIRLKLGNADYLTFSGLVTTNRTAYFPDADVNIGHIISLSTLSGVAGGSTNLGVFTGSVIGNGRTIKAALQDLETYSETNIDNLITDLNTEITNRTNADTALDVRVTTLEGVIPAKEKFLMNALPTNLTYIDLSYEAIQLTLQVSVDRILLHEDDDYTISVVGGVTRLTWVNDIAVGGSQALDATDTIRVKYYYQA